MASRFASVLRTAVRAGARPGALRAASGASLAAGPIRLAPRVVQRTTRDILENIDLMVCDMAGTTVQEGGLVYTTLRLSMVEHGLQVSTQAMEPWHGARKESVIEHFAREAGTPEAEMEELVTRIGDRFVGAIDEAYFSEASAIGPIADGLVGYFGELRRAGVKVALNTGYPQNIQEGLVDRLGFRTAVDAYISSYEVPEGRPYPFMVHRLMEKLHISSARRVAKVGDSVRDMEEGVNAGCGLVVGVLSGADDADALFAAGADVVADYVTDLPVPRKRGKATARIPDLS